MPDRFVIELLLILTAGLVANVACRRWGISTIVGYLASGALLGVGALGLVDPDGHEVELLAEAGIFLLLFTVGLEFSLDELRSLAWRLPVGGLVQMGLVAVPIALVCRWFGMPWPGAMLLAAATSFSSTVLVFKTLADLGQAATPHGRRAIGILLFQDIALVPLLLAVPLLTGETALGSREIAILAVSTVAFVAAVFLLRSGLRWLLPRLAGYRSPDVVVLLTLVVIGLTTLGAYTAGLPAELGAFAAGLCFGGNRWSAQVDALVLPFRETFAAIFFIGLGLLIDVHLFVKMPFYLVGAAVLLVGLKASAAFFAVRLAGLPTRAALGVGLGLAHVGEFAYFLGGVALKEQLVTAAAYQQFAAIAFLTLIVTPSLLRFGLKLVGHRDDAALDDHGRSNEPSPELAVVIGAGPVGNQVASCLETRGVAVAMIDRSPVNLYPLSQAGMHTVAGDAADVAVLRAAGADRAGLAVVCVSSDEAAEQIVTRLRELNPTVRLLVRCRFMSNVHKLKKLGAAFVVSEEQQAYTRLISEIERE